MELKKRETEELKEKKKDLKVGLTPEMKRRLEVLHSLKKQGDLATVIDFASESLDKQEGSDAAIEELLQIEKDWMAAHDLQFVRLAKFLERYAIVPMGGVEG